MALAAVKGDPTTSELPSLFGVRLTQIAAWKKQLLDGAAEFFADGRQDGKTLVGKQGETPGLRLPTGPPPCRYAGARRRLAPVNVPRRRDKSFPVRQNAATSGGVNAVYFLPLAEVRPGLSVVMEPLPSGRVLLLEPLERLVIVPEPKGRVVPVTVLPLRSRSVVMVPLPKGRDCVVVPLDQRVIVPEPSFCVVPVIVLPLLSRSVVMEPLPKRRVLLLEPSERLVMVPEPNGRVVPVRCLWRELLGGSTAQAMVEASVLAKATTNDKRVLSIFHAFRENAPVLANSPLAAIVPGGWFNKQTFFHAVHLLCRPQAA